MNSTLRALACATLTATLLAGGAATSYAAASPSPKGSASASAEQPSLTITVDKAEVKAGEKVHVTGRTKGLKIGSKVVLQHRKDGKWTTLKAETVVKNGSSYALDGKLNTKGREELRVLSGDVFSPSTTVTVR
ncbi:hypothetical protein ABZ766_31070 [Streptomyces sp. NPDC006670]|uniref:hypothetical protein n=1 Tax=Streptomyces sp. NPDC006670 TaxID=3154476 RepID=UPI0033F1EE69